MVLNYYARNYSESLAPACSPPESGGTRGGLNYGLTSPLHALGNALSMYSPHPPFYATKLQIIFETTKHFSK